MNTRRPFLSLFLCLALAVNLLAPFAYAGPLFTEICTSHGTVLVPSDDAPDPGICDVCSVACANALAPEGWTLRPIDLRLVTYETRYGISVGIPTLPDRQARAPPILPA